MSEGVHAREKPRTERCPYCHADLVAATLDAPDPRVACAKCGAAHHAECFVENAGCSVMGCGAAEARPGAGAEPMPVGVISAALERGDLGSLDEGEEGTFSWGTLLVFGGVWLLVTFLVLLFAGPQIAAVIGALLILGPAALWALLRDVPDAPLGAAPGGSLEQEIRRRSQWEYIPQQPYEVIQRAIDAQSPEDPGAARPPAATGPAPARCPACQGALDAPQDEENVLSFCYHCGASLA